MSGYSGRLHIDIPSLEQGKDNTTISPQLLLEKIFDTPLPNFKIQNSLEGSFDFIQCFTVSGQDLDRSFPKLKGSLKETEGFWISWPKSSSNVPSDLNENLISEVVLRNCLVDVKVIVVDKDWSGLKFVHRLRGRKGGEV